MKVGHSTWKKEMAKPQKFVVVFEDEDSQPREYFAEKAVITPSGDLIFVTSGTTHNGVAQGIWKFFELENP